MFLFTGLADKKRLLNTFSSFQKYFIPKTKCSVSHIKHNYHKKVLDSKMVMEKNDENIGPQLICTKLSLSLSSSEHGTPGQTHTTDHMVSYNEEGHQLTSASKVMANSLFRQKTCSQRV